MSGCVSYIMLGIAGLCNLVWLIVIVRVRSVSKCEFSVSGGEDGFGER